MSCGGPRRKLKQALLSPLSEARLWMREDWRGTHAAVPSSRGLTRPHCGDRAAGSRPSPAQGLRMIFHCSAPPLPRLPPQPTTTQPLNAVPLCGSFLSHCCLHVGVSITSRVLQPARCCGCLQVKLALSMSLPDFPDKPKPCGLIWGPVTETALCSPNRLPFPPVDRARLHFPAAPAVGVAM